MSFISCGLQAFLLLPGFINSIPKENISIPVMSLPNSQSCQNSNLWVYCLLERLLCGGSKWKTTGIRQEHVYSQKAPRQNHLTSMKKALEPNLSKPRTSQKHEKPRKEVRGFNFQQSATKDKNLFVYTWFENPGIQSLTITKNSGEQCFAQVVIRDKVSQHHKRRKWYA